MKCFSWKRGSVSEGINLIADEKLGSVVFLGETGRGRRYEKVALGRRNPAEVKDVRVFDAQTVKITLPPKDGRPEKIFYVLEKPENAAEEILVRINTYTSYIRGGQGCWRTIAGNPETVISGFGAFGDAGRIGNWEDGLVIMKPGDVLRVYPSRGDSSALWIEKGKPTCSSWQDYENLQAVAKAQSVIAEAEKKHKELEVLHGEMSCFSFSGGAVTPGLSVVKGATGKVIAFGEEGRGRYLLEIPLVKIEPKVFTDNYGQTTETINMVAVVKLDEKVIKSEYSWIEPTKKIFYGLTSSTKKSDNFLVRISSACGYTRRGSGKIETWKGKPEALGCGHGADGDAGRIGSWEDGLFVMHKEDFFYVRPSGDGPRYAVFVRDGAVQSEEWTAWKIKDSKLDPDFYVKKETAPWGHVPAEWIGQVVSVITLGERSMIGNRPTPAFREKETGELILIAPDQVVLNLGWDGKDRHDVTFNGGLFVKLEKDKKVNRLEGEAAETRMKIRAQAESLRSKARECLQTGHLSQAEKSLQKEIAELAAEQEFDTMPTEGFCSSLTAWVEKASRIIDIFTAAEADLKKSEEDQKAGKILVNFSSWHRRGGNSGNGDGWVVMADGNLREPDTKEVPRHKHDGTYIWNLVKEDELALQWSCGSMHDIVGSSEFKIMKRPVGGLTEAQKQAVVRIETEDIRTVENSFGLNPESAKKSLEKLKEIKRVFSLFPDDLVSNWQPEWTLLKVVGKNGVEISPCADCFKRIDYSEGFNDFCEGREAQILYGEYCADGKLEALAYDKYGQLNCNLRWRELREGEAKPEKKIEAVLDETPVEISKIDLSKLFNGNARKK
jgi:hypothetical protein